MVGWYPTRKMCVLAQKMIAHDTRYDTIILLLGAILARSFNTLTLKYPKELHLITFWGLSQKSHGEIVPLHKHNLMTLMLVFFFEILQHSV